MIFVILLLTIFTLLAYFTWKSSYGVYSYWRSRGIPIAPGCLPIVGHMGPVLRSRKSFFQLVDECYKMFPNNSMVGFNHSGSHSLIVREPELVKAVLQSSFSSFHKNKMHINPELDPLLADHPFFTWGEIWSTARKNLTYAFSSMRLKILAEIVQEVSNRFKDYLDNKLKKHDTVELELKDVFSRFTGETLANVGFGVQGFCFQDEYHPMSFRNPADEIFAPSITQILPIFFPKLSKYMRISFVPKKIDYFFRELVKQIVDERKRGRTPRCDFLQLMLDRAQSEGVEIDIDRLTGDAFTFYIDGHETSNTTLSLTGFQLASNPGIQQKLREHVRKVLEKHEGVINFESLKDMTYLDQVINEAMRRTPALHALLKLCTEEFELKGSDGVSCRVKPGTEIIIPVYGIQNDPKYWTDPKVFDPDRFAPDKKDEITKFSFLPFGDGPRICVGMRMALLQMKAALATIVTNYVFTLSAKTKVPLKMDPKMFLAYPVGGIWVDLKRL